MKQAHSDASELTREARKVLQENDLGKWTRPTAGLYPHQWLWDSCFIAIGLRHTDIARAQDEIRSLLKAQWHNGMIPHVIFSDAKGYHAGPSLWKTHTCPDCPKNVKSTGISQPPLLAEAAVRIGELLGEKDRLVWYAEVFPAIARFHEWLYRERDPNHTGLVTIVHPWETGLDNMPPWMEILHNYAVSKRLWLMESLSLDKFVERFRKDTSVVPANERMSTLDLYAIYALIRKLRERNYDNAKTLQKQKLLLVDLVYNSILVRATDQLAEVAKAIGQELSPHTKAAHAKGMKVLETFWDSEKQEYFCQDYRSGDLVRVSSIATFMPLYAGKLPQKHVEALLDALHDPIRFGADYPIPSAPLYSPYFKPHCYWQGPTWVNTNWMIIDGLERNGQHAEAQKLRHSTLELVSKQGMREYFSPLDGRGAGSSNFSWTAALTLDLLHQTEQQ